jgi:hypothetical protein
MMKKSMKNEYKYGKSELYLMDLGLETSSIRVGVATHDDFKLDISHSVATSCLSLKSLSSLRDSLIPLPDRREMTGFLPSPMMKMLLILVAKALPLLSLT